MEEMMPYRTDTESNILDWTDLDDASIVDEHVDDAVFPHDLRDSPFDLFTLPNVAHDGHRASVAAGEIRLGARKLVRISRSEHEPRAFRRQLAGDDQAEAARPAKDENRFVCKINRAQRTPCPRGEHSSGHQRDERSSTLRVCHDGSPRSRSCTAHARRGGRG